MVLARSRRHGVPPRPHAREERGLLTTARPAASPPYFGDETAAPGRNATAAWRMGPGAVPLLPAHGHGRRGLGGKAGSRRALREALRRAERAVHVHHHADRDAGGLRAHLLLHRPHAAPHHAPGLRPS